ncbi:MAG: ABC transporter permease [Candidatus Caldarchaeum sp.]
MLTREYSTNESTFVKIIGRLKTVISSTAEALRYMVKIKITLAALIFILTIVAMAVLADVISPYDPNFQDLSRRREGPSLEHPFGLDEFGRDILSRVIHGARVSLIVGTGVISISLLTGILLGMVGGYFGGKIDTAIVLLSDIFLAFPGLVFAIGLMAVLGQSIVNVILSLVIINWPGYARVVRGQVLSLREMTFVEATKLMGASSMFILFNHILPNTTSPLIVLATIGMGWAILAEAGLSFLGLGLKPPTPSWGSMISSGRTFLLDAPHIATIPGIFLTLTILSFNIIGDSLRDALDPKMKL